MDRLEGMGNWVKLELDQGGLDVILEFLWEVIRLIVLCKVTKRVIGYLDNALVAFYWNVYVPYVQGKHVTLHFHVPLLLYSVNFYIYAYDQI